MSAGESIGCHKSANVSSSSYRDSLQQNWHGSLWLIRPVSTGTPLHVSSSGLCNTISWSHSSEDYLHEERSRGTLSEPAMFQRVMDWALQPHNVHAAAHFDDIILYSNDWEWHIQHVKMFLKSLRWAGLTANPTKCVVGQGEVHYLGFYGEVHPNLIRLLQLLPTWNQRPKRR